MPAVRLSMRKIQEILRLKWEQELSGREVARSCHVSPSTVSDVVDRASLAGLSWPLPKDMDEAALEARLYPPRQSQQSRAEPDFQKMYRELKIKGVTERLLWLEYRTEHPDDGYSYSQYCALYRGWKRDLSLVMRQDHRAGEKAFVDYAGVTMAVTDPDTGEVTDHQVFVVTLGASSYTYAEAQEGQTVRCWVRGHIHAWEYFGGVTEIMVPDNLKAGVIKPCLYEPQINRTYDDLARHYDTVIIPARKRKPKDKAKVENGVQQVERWVIAPLRKQTFFSLRELNEAIAEQLEWLNNRSFSKIEGSRRSLFEEIDRPALKPLPPSHYTMAEWKVDVAVNIDYHIEFDRHYYSVPCILAQRHEKVDVRVTATTVECFLRGNRIASHPRSYQQGKNTTEPEHMPESHRRHAEWTPSRLIHWASDVGPSTAQVVETIMESKRHPEQGYRACLGIMRLSKKYSAERTENACARAVAMKSCTYGSVQSILKAGLDRQTMTPTQSRDPIDHPNVRGAGYYH